MINYLMWNNYFTPLYMFLIKLLPLVGVALLVILAVLWFRFIRNRIYDILHPEGDIKTTKTNTWYKPPAEREKIEREEKEGVEDEKEV